MPISDNSRFFVHHVANRAFQCCSCYISNEMAANLPVVRYSRKHRYFARATTPSARSLVTRFADPDIGLIAFNRAGGLRAVGVGSYRKSNPIHQKQSGLIAYLTAPLDLQCRDTFL